MTNTAMSAYTTTVHQLPTSCHVCGTPAARNLTCSDCGRSGAPCHRARPSCTHDLTNAEADAAAREHDRRTTVVYPSGATTPEGAYIEGTRSR